MQYDRKIKFTQGASRKAINWQGVETTWGEFIKKFTSPVRGTETLDEYVRLTKGEQDSKKDVGGFVGGSIKGSRRKANAVEYRDLVTLDLDQIPNGMTEDVVKHVQTLGCGYMIYSTRKHASYRPRLRIIVPTDRSMTVDEYEPIARRLAEMIGIEMADQTTFEPSRLMYWPSACKDGEYVFKFEDKPMLSADGMLNTYDNWKDVTQWPTVPGEAKEHRRLIAKQQDPREKRGLIGAFCRTYSIYGAMEKFIPTAYDETATEGRFSYLGGSTSGGAIVYQDGLFLYSHHATDPCGGELVNAWDLVRLHKFSDLDIEVKWGTPIVQYPSYKAMVKLALADEDVMALRNQEEADKVSSYFEDLEGADAQNGNMPSGSKGKDSDDSPDGPEQDPLVLDTNENGRVESSVANVVKILNEDLNYKGKIFVDTFANRAMVKLPLPWDNGEGTRLWNDYDMAQLVLRLEKIYKITGEKKIETALKVIGFNNRQNEVKELLKSIKWDGQDRIRTLLIDYLGAEDNIYTREIMEKALIAAACRACSDTEVKFDQMVILSGPQGCGKSTFFRKLGMDWFSDSLYTVEGKEAAELIQGALVVEMPELSAMNKTESEAVKQFLSKTSDIYRAPYAKNTAKFPRRCVFFGTTNSDSFLKDATGERRFWPVRIMTQRPTKDLWKDLTEEEVQQIWAEAYFHMLIGTPMELSEEAKETALEMQEEFKDVSPKAGIIAEFLDREIPDNWYSLNIQDQRSFINNEPSFLDSNKDIVLVERDKVCVAEIWQICLQGDIKYMRRSNSNEIIDIMSGTKGWGRNRSVRRYGNFGVQKGFEKVNKRTTLNVIEGRK